LSITFPCVYVVEDVMRLILPIRYCATVRVRDYFVRPDTLSFIVL